MDFFKRLLGSDDTATQPRNQQRPSSRRRELSPDEQAIERYRYLVRTAPPETIEEVHAEAFAKLTPEQRQMVLEGLTQDLPASEQRAAAAGDDPRALARVATRAEMRAPGTLERTWNRMPAGGMGGMGMGGFMAGNFMSTIAGVMVGSMIADAFLGSSGFDPGLGDIAADAGAAVEGGVGEVAGGIGDFGSDLGADLGGFGDFGGDFGGDF
ncbi:MAG: lipase chaperone [Chloroflexota bacterium]|nr:lipase chaperone [Chloroflexota bacterium]